MQAYFVRDNDPQGGTLAVYRSEPDIEAERVTIAEVRKGEFPDDVWLKIFFGELQVSPMNFLDDVISPYFNQAEVVWTSEGGYVNGS